MLTLSKPSFVADSLTGVVILDEAGIADGRRLFRDVGVSARGSGWVWGYEVASGVRISRDPIAEDGGINLYGYCGNNPINFIDPLGLDAVLIYNGPTQGNPLGHRAIAVSGGGVYSFGNSTPLGSSLVDYLKREAPRRDTTIYYIKTTPEQDKAMLDYLKSAPKKLDNVATDNCVTRTQAAMAAGGMPSPSIDITSWLRPFGLQPNDPGTPKGLLGKCILRALRLLFPRGLPQIIQCLLVLFCNNLSISEKSL